jgi:hypothetical protein
MYCYIFSGVDQKSNTPQAMLYVQCNKDREQAMEIEKNSHRGNNNTKIDKLKR